VASQSWENLLNGGAPWQTTNGPTITVSTALQTITPQAPTTQDFVLPGQYNGLQWYPAMTLKVEARGQVSAGGTTSNWTFSLALGGSGAISSAGTALLTSGAVTSGTTLTSIPWRFEGVVRVLALGSTGTTLSSHGCLELATAALVAPTLGTAGGSSASMIAETTTAWNTYTAGTAMGMRVIGSAAFGTVICNSFLIEQLA
jgi:hypothetical protein